MTLIGIAKVEVVASWNTAGDTSKSEPIIKL